MKLCIAGASSFEKVFKKAIPIYMLESFYYIKEWQYPLIQSSDLFLLDSGAFTFMNSSKSKVNFDEYLEKYIAFINEHDVKYFFELDIDVVVGYEEVKRLRKKLEEGTRKKCIPVWHKSRGLQEWKKLCNDYDYVAIGGIVTKEITKKDYSIIKKLIHYATTQGTKVHGLGFTNKNCSEYGFYSVDSTNWVSCGRFGGVDHFDGEKIIKVDTPKGKKCINYYIRLEHSLKEWIKYQKYLKTK